MFPIVTFAPAAILLLSAPGPSNAQLAAAGVREGRAKWRFLVAVAGGYAISVGGLTLIGAPALAAMPYAGPILKSAAAAWLLWNAFKMWVGGARGVNGGASISAGALLVTTMLNPKCFVLAFGLMPSAEQGFASQLGDLAMVCLIASIAGGIWMTAGGLLARTGVIRYVSKATAAIFGTFGAILIASVVSR